MANLKPHNHENQTKRFSNGANTTIGKERAIEGKELYYNGRNGRTTSDEGNYGDFERIDGESLKYDLGVDENYRCMAGFIVNGYVIAIWSHSTDHTTYPAFISIDDQIVLQSSDFDVDVNDYIQYDINENALGGEFFFTNYDVPPFIFNVQDLLDNIDTEKYFDDFEPAAHQINLDTPLDHPVFDGLSFIGGTSGLPTGQYEYSIRYVSETGDKTALSYATPLIFVPRSYKETEAGSWATKLYPFYKTFGQEPSEVSTAYGVKIRFRVNNLFNFDYIEIIRTAYNGGEGIDFTPISYIVKKIPILPNEFSVKTYIDCDSLSDTPIPISEFTSQSYLAKIKRARAIRYYNRRLTLFNVEYEPFDIGDLTYLNEGEVDMFYPFTESLGNAGHKNPLYHAYKRSLMNSEKYGWAILGFGSSFQTSFASVIPGYISYEMPPRRQAMEAHEIAASISPVLAANTEDDITETFELFDLEDAVKRDTPMDNGYVNILDSNESGTYAVRHPISQTDPLDSHYIRNMDRVYLDSKTIQEYNPYGFNLNYHSMGMALAGLDNYPSEMKAFSIVRTKRAGRVVCQGLAMYNLQFGSPVCGKNSAKFIFYAPDLYNGVIDPATLDAILANPGNYRLRLESPVGFFSDIYLGLKDIDGSDDGCIDMITYARVLKEAAAKRINIGDTATDIGFDDGTDGYVGYGKWRNDLHGAGDSVWGDGQTGDHLFTLSAAENHEEPQGYPYIVITVTETVYKTLNSGTDVYFNDASVKNWHEPFYVASIIDDGAEVSEDNVINFQKTEHYQKIKAQVGTIDGTLYQEFETVDERWEDFHVEAGDTTTDKYIYVENSNGTEERFINITEKTAPEIALIEAAISGGTTYGGVLIYGKYKSKVVDGIYIIYFDADTDFPETVGARVFVKYDNRFPCKVFGGDTFVGESVFTVLNRKQAADGTLGSFDESEMQQEMHVGFPYGRFDLNDDIVIIKNATGGLFGDQVQNNNEDMTLDYIRQMLVMFTCSSYSHLCLAYNDHFPLINYVHRPCKWDKTGTLADNNIYEQYETDYPGEMSLWNYGGFRQQQLGINIDYSKESITVLYVSKPETGFSEETLFPTRIAWSLQRPMNSSIVPSLRTFIVNNVYDLEDKYGQGQFLFDANSKIGRNLYGFTESNAYLLYTEKNIITSLDGEQIATQGGTGDVFFIQKEEPLNLPGMPANVWRFAKELNGELYYADYNGVYKFNGELENIEGFYRKSLQEILLDLRNTARGTKMVGYIDSRYNEYGMYFFNTGTSNGLSILGRTKKDFQTEFFNCVTETKANNQSKLYLTNVPNTGTYTGCMTNSGDYDLLVYELDNELDFGSGVLVFTVPAGESVNYTVAEGVWSSESTEDCDACQISNYDDMVVFSDKIKNWNGNYSFKFDYFATADQKTYGFRDGLIYELHSGNAINGSNMNFNIIVVFNPEDWKFQSFVRFAINANIVPTRVEILDEDLNVISTMDAADIRDYGNWEQYINLTITNPKRIQGQKMMMRLAYDGTTSKIVVKSITSQYKNVY